MSKLVKICGLRTEEAAAAAIASGADMLGVIMVPGRARSIDHDVARAISAKVRAARTSGVADLFKPADTYQQHFDQVSEAIRENGPYLVGVFRNQNIEQVFSLAQSVGVDFIQLHGSENLQEYLDYNERTGSRFGIIRRFVIPQDVPDITFCLLSLLKNGNPGRFALALLDSEAGGEGKKIDWSLLHQLEGRFVLAGGLTPDNLGETAQYKNIIGYDVSGGVENADGSKNLDKIAAFIRQGHLIA